MYCQRCDTEFERGDECMCRRYGAWMATLQPEKVPSAWMHDWYDGCTHPRIEYKKDGSRACPSCGYWYG